MTNRFGAFVRGEGGFGGNGGPQPAPAPPEREPDLVVERPTAEGQALLYRLSGDKNGAVALDVGTKKRDTPVLSNALVTLWPPA